MGMAMGGLRLICAGGRLRVVRRTNMADIARKGNAGCVTRCRQARDDDLNDKREDRKPSARKTRDASAMNTTKQRERNMVIHRR